MKEVGRQILYQQGCFSRQKIWYEGHTRGIKGTFTWGWQGEPQTVVTKDIITPLVVFEVRGALEVPLTYD
jgi:hypothetical protein